MLGLEDELSLFVFHGIALFLYPSKVFAKNLLIGLLVLSNTQCEEIHTHHPPTRDTLPSRAHKILEISAPDVFVAENDHHGKLRLDAVPARVQD